MRSLLLSILLVVVFSICGNAQIDTSYYMPKYPTGQEGFIRDIEAFAGISQEEKDILVENEIQISLLILESGEIRDAFVKGNVSDDLKQRVKSAAMKLYDFVPAKSKGVNVESTYVTSINYSIYQPLYMRRFDSSEYEPTEYAWSMELGGYGGKFLGDIANVYGANGGMLFGMGGVFNNYLLNIDFGLGGAQKNGIFSLPPEVVEESNDVHFFYGISLSRFIEVNNRQSVRVKVGVGGYSINAGFLPQREVYRLNGWDVYSELSYAIVINESIANQPYVIRNVRHYITPFVQLHQWLGNEQSNGNLLSLGLKYSFESYGMKKKNVK